MSRGTPKILVKKAKNLSSACAMCANEINVKNWFKEYEKVLADLNITSPEQIWSVETKLGNKMYLKRSLSLHRNRFQQTKL